MKSILTVIVLLFIVCGPLQNYWDAQELAAPAVNTDGVGGGRFTGNSLVLLFAILPGPIAFGAIALFAVAAITLPAVLWTEWRKAWRGKP